MFMMLLIVNVGRSTPQPGRQSHSLGLLVSIKLVDDVIGTNHAHVFQTTFSKTDKHDIVFGDL